MGQDPVRVRRTWLVVAAALGLVGAVCLVMWGASAANGPEPVSTAEHTPTSSLEPGPATTAAALEEDVARPVEIEVASIGLTSSLLRLGLRRDGTVEVPSDPDLAGWFRRGPPPGAVGSSVILGHRDSTHGPAVFYRLGELSVGDLVTVRLDDGTTVRFAVHSTRVYANDDFPAERVYGSHGRRELNLVTCGGGYDSDRGGYQANVVVNARLVS